ncbi:MAG: hypothetical protein JST33_02715 [Actinobacteria bacterium]|nr:hypothetical protein [Actinomycetota bacterium]
MDDAFDSLDAWRGRLTGRQGQAPTIVLRAPRERARSSGAGAFLGLADDGRTYWVKVPGNPQGDQVLVNEVIVGELGRLIGAPVRERVLIRIPPSISRWDMFPAGRSDAPLIAHGSLHVPGAIDDDDLRYTRRDDNARRQSAMVALWDLCLGEDPQWLYETTAAYSMWSYDHGLWFTTGEGDWEESVLRRLVTTDGTFPHIPTGLDRRRLLDVADAILGLTPEALLSVMSAVPVEWGTDDRSLEAMAWFLFRRREPVAQRLRRHAEAPSGGQATGTPK